MTPKFTTGQHLIHYGKEMEVLEVIEDTFGSLNQYRLKNIETGEELEAFENTLYVITTKVEPVKLDPLVIEAHRKAVEKPYTPPPQKARLDRLPEFQMVTDDTIPTESHITFETLHVDEAGRLKVDSDVLNLERWQKQQKREDVKRSVFDQNKIRAALKTGNIQDLIDLISSD